MDTASADDAASLDRHRGFVLFLTPRLACVLYKSFESYFFVFCEKSVLTIFLTRVYWLPLSRCIRATLSACSLMVELPAHNGLGVGSSPAGRIIFRD